MGVFRSKNPNDVLFLMPVRFGSEKLPRRKVRMLYCDAAGKIYAPLISRSVYEHARDTAQRMEQSRKPYATLGLEISPGNYAPAAVEIGPKEVWALERILEHALQKGRLPDILKKYLKPIIMLGAVNREAVLSEHKKRRRRVPIDITPHVLNRLPYYPERGIELSMPIYKAEYSYPLIVLRRILPNRSTSRSPQRLLILDSDGDLAIIKVPYKLIENTEKGLTAQERKNQRNVCAVILKQPEGMSIDYIPVSQLQRKALDTITRYFEVNRTGKQPISAAVKAVLTRAKDKVSSTVE